MSMENVFHRWFRLFSGNMILLVLVLLLVTACGSDGEEIDDTGDVPPTVETTSAAGLAEWLFYETKQQALTCASDLYFGEERIALYFSDNKISGRACQALGDDAVLPEFERMLVTPSVFGYFEIENEGTYPGTATSGPLPYVEGTAHSSDGAVSLHFSRLVEHDGHWYVLVLRSHVQGLY